MKIPWLEWPTLLLALLIHLAWLATTLATPQLPIWLAVAAGAVIIAWHGSLQHEATHGHPTRSRALNQLIAGAPLSVWLPFAIYRETHLEHHLTEALTDPERDPESFYIAPKAWRRAGPVRRALATATHTLAGRLILGPAIVIARTWAGELRLIAAGDRRRAAIWARHLIGVAVVAMWVIGVCGVHPLLYLGAFVYPGLSLTLLRSFAEHRPAAEREHRSAVVEAHPLWAALFLNNNLHALHHAEPWRPWYQLPARYRERRAEILAANGDYLIRGYGSLARRYALRIKDSPAYPGEPSC